MKILIIGANGFTGRHLLTYLCKSNENILHGCSLHEDIQPISGYEFHQADICNDEEQKKWFQIIKPDVVINTAALSVPDYCETYHEEALKLNAIAVENMARLCETNNSRFIHLSTDFVFDGKSDKLYIESDEPNPVNYYGVTKWEGEKRIARYCNNYAIVRVVVVYGKSLPGQHGNIVQLVANKLRAGEKIRVVSDQWRTPTYVEDIEKGIEKLLSHHENGIFHICGPDYVSIADIAFEVAEHLKLDKSLIEPVTTEEMQEKTPRPKFSGLSIEKAKTTLGYTPLSLKEGIQSMFE